MCAFRDSTADRIKLIFWDGTGLVLYAKRLEEGVAAVRKYRLRSHPVIRWGRHETTRRAGLLWQADWNAGPRRRALAGPRGQ